MASSALKKSVLEFEQKKRQCLEFIKAVEIAETALAKELPQADNPQTQRLNLDSIRAAYDRISEAALRILIAGQFKTGKSTLVNAMLGQAVLPAYSTPCTAVITEIEYAPKAGAELHFKQHLDREHLSANIAPAVAAHIRESADPVPPLRLELATQAELEQYLAIDEYEEDQAQGVSGNPVEVCKLYWPLDFCRGDAVIIDSPGLNENGARDKTTMDYVPKADMILHVLNAQQIYGLPDQQFIKSLAIMGEFPLLFVVNRFDLLNSDKERERVRNYALKKLLPHTVYGEDGIFFTSAERALQGRAENDAAQLGNSGVPDFEQKVAEIFNGERLKIKLGHIHSVLRELDYIVRDFLPRLSSALNEDAVSLEEQYQTQTTILKKLDGRIQRIMDSCEAEISLFQERLQNELQALFMRFRDAVLVDIVENTDISGFNVSDNHEKAEATGLLIARIDDAMKDAIARWQKEEGEPLYRATLARIQKQIEQELEDFNMLMQILDDSWAIDGVAPRYEKIELSVDGNGIFVVGGLAAGGGIAGMAALALLPARFLGEFAGPVGWLVVALTTALGAALAYWSKDVARKNLKENFIKESRKLMAEKSDEWACDISIKIANSMGENILLLIQELKKRVEDAKRPLLIAIELLQKNQGDVERQRKSLEDFAVQFAQLKQKGAEIASGI